MYAIYLFWNASCIAMFHRFSIDHHLGEVEYKKWQSSVLNTSLPDCGSSSCSSRWATRLRTLAPPPPPWDSRSLPSTPSPDCAAHKKNQKGWDGRQWTRKIKDEPHEQSSTQARWQIALHLLHLWGSCLGGTISWMQTEHLTRCPAASMTPVEFFMNRGVVYIFCRVDGVENEALVVDFSLLSPL